MLEELLNLVKQSSQEAVVDNPEIPNEQNAAVMEEAGSSVVSTLQSMMAGGQASQVMSLFGSNAQDVNNNAVTQNISGNFINNITQKLGISPKVAAGIAAVVIPMIISKLVKKTNDPSDSSFNVQDIFNKLSNNGTSGMNITDILSKFGGGSNAQASSGGGGGLLGGLLDRDGDGDTDLNDLTAAFSGKSSNDGNAGGGGILDQLKGMFGK